MDAVSKERLRFASMRNPFRRRRRKLPGAKSEWNEAEHIPLGDSYVAVPEDQLPAQTIERLAGVQLYKLDKMSPDAEGLGVFINVDAVNAEVEAKFDGYVGIPNDDEMEVVVEAAFNNPANWAKGGIDSMGDDAQYALFRVDPVTGQILRGETSS